MGGEPTLWRDRDRDAAEWNTAALGPFKRGYANALVRRSFVRSNGDGGFCTLARASGIRRAVARAGRPVSLAQGRDGITTDLAPTSISLP